MSLPLPDKVIDLRSGTVRPTDRFVDVPNASPLDLLADELGAVDPGKVALLVDARPGWSITYSLNLDGGKLLAWRHACRDDLLDGIDQEQFARTVLAAQCVDIRREGAVVTDDSGRPLTFHSSRLWELLKVPAASPSGATEAVGRFYANGFAAEMAAERIISDAGFGRPARAAPDPTPGSSSS